MSDQPSNLHEYSVSELSGKVKNLIEDNFSLVRVRGELGRVTRAGSGHVYLDLKDDRAVVNGVIWKGNAARLKIDPEQGMEIVATGRMTTFAGQSRYQLVIDSLEPAGVGALMALFEERKKRLASEGLFDPERKQEIPFMPATIGVVTSPTGAVIRDILHRLRERCPSHVLVWPTLVQGKEAERQIVAAINGFNQIDGSSTVPRPDVLIVARGGGSLEDLWCFNEEGVARAAAASKIPVISAVGHETDTTLIDFVADRRAPTPTAAAEMASPVHRELRSELLNKERRLIDANGRIIENAHSALRAAVRGLGRPEDVLGSNTQKLDRASDRLLSGIRARLQKVEQGFAHANARFGPSVLSSGFQERENRLSRATVSMRTASHRTLERRLDRLGGLRLNRATLETQLSSQSNRLQITRERFANVARQDVKRNQVKLDGLAKLLSSLSHRSVLARGFALVHDDAGALVRSVKTLKNGQPGAVEFADGKVDVTFGKHGAPARPSNPKTEGAAKTSKQAKTPKHMSSEKPATQKTLFD